jgi:hypothetical protein
MNEITYNYAKELETLFESYGLDGMINRMQLAEVIQTALTVTVVAGLLLGFFGLKLIRVWGALLGFVIGCAGGAAVGIVLGQNTQVVLIIAGVAGLVVAILCAVLRRISAFLVSLVSGIGVCAAVLEPQELTPVLICAGVGLVLAILAVVCKEPVIMVLTGVAGAFAAGQVIAVYFALDGQTGQIVLVAILAALGIVVQFLMESGRRKRRNLKKAAEIRQHNSTANVVERARAVMEDLDDLPEEADITFLDIDETEEGEDGEKPEDAEDDILFLDDDDEEEDR